MRRHWSITGEGLWVAQAKPLLNQLSALVDRPGQLKRGLEPIDPT